MWPAHDARDFEFAHKFDLPIIEVISPDGAEHGVETCFSDDGVMINSGSYSGLTSAEGSAQITAALAAQKTGGPQITYKMRDWLISRQRYWGAPIPIIHCPNCGVVPVSEQELPVQLPDTDDFAPAGDGRSPLARASEWVNTNCPQCGAPAQRETDTMDGFACSSWYFLRFVSPHYQDGPFDPAALDYWAPADVYVGGAEHAVMHLLYARFWTKVIFDTGLIPFNEPFPELKNQGILHSALDGQRMSKSKGNVVTPDEVVARHGADALRAYILFLGPFDADAIWDDSGIKGITRFLDRYWRVANLNTETQSRNEQGKDKEFERRRHQVIERITADMERFRFNTAVAALMEYLNYLVEVQDKDIPASQWRQAMESFTLLLAPIAPFITEEVWQTALGHSGSVHRQSWPTYDAEIAAEEQVTIVVQVNGKVRDRLTAPADVDEITLRETAVARPKVQHYINGQTVRKVIVIPQRLINIVI